MTTPTIEKRAAGPEPAAAVIEGKPAPADWTDPGGKCVTVVFNPVSGQGDPEQRKTII